jgi:Uma2 family endonuclease
VESEPAANGPLSIEAWAELDEDVDGEFVDGRIEEEEMPTALHEAIVGWLLWALRSWAAVLGGLTFGSELKLRVTPTRGRKADLSVYLLGRRLPSKRASSTRRAPSIVVEVLSPRPRDVRRDVVDKKLEYAAFGVSYYWIVDPQARTLEVFELGADGRYSVALSAAAGTHEMPGCQGLTLDLDAMWSSADGLPDEEEPSADE